MRKLIGYHRVSCAYAMHFMRLSATVVIRYPMTITISSDGFRRLSFTTIDLDILTLTINFRLKPVHDIHVIWIDLTISVSRILELLILELEAET